MRADKACLAGITTTLLHYLKDEAEHEIPIWKMISEPLEAVMSRAEGWLRELGTGSVEKSESTVGGGSLPGESFPSYVLSLTVKSPDKFLNKLRRQYPPIVARTANDRILFDPRTVLPEQEKVLIDALRQALRT